MPISELDIFQSLMKDPNHAYNPIGKVWAEAQQRARQFRNNEKALALAFDDSPALEKLFDFVQKADEADEDEEPNYMNSLEENIPAYEDFIRKINAFNAARMTYGEDSVPPVSDAVLQRIMQSNSIMHDWGGGRGRESSLESSLHALNTSAQLLGGLRDLIREAQSKDNPQEFFDRAINANEQYKNFVEGYIRGTGAISPILTSGLDKFLNHEEIQQIHPPTPPTPEETSTTEETSGAARGEGPSDEERDTLFGGGSTQPNLGTGMIQDDEQDNTSESDTSATGDTGATEETNEEEVEYPPFTLQTLNDLIASHLIQGQRINQPETPEEKLVGWPTNIKLTSPQFRTLNNLGIVSGASHQNYNWTNEGETVRRLLTFGNRTQANRGRAAQPLHPVVFDALHHAIVNNYITGHIPDTAIAEERNTRVDPNGTTVSTEDGIGHQTTGERETVTTDNITNMSPEGWQDYMREYPHKELDRYRDDESYAEALEAGRVDEKQLLFPRELGSWENGEYIEGVPIHPFINAEGVHLQDMKDEEGNLSPEGKAHVHDMFRRLIDIFHASNHKGSEEHPSPDSIRNRFGTPNERRGRHYYTIDVTADGFPKNAYNSYLENNGVLEQYLLKFGELLGLTTARQVQSLVNDQDTGTRIQKHERGEIDTSTGEPTEQPINPATGEPYPYTAADIDSFIDENNFPDDLKKLTWGDSRNSELPQDHPAYRGGIYTPSYTRGDDIYIHEGSWAWADALYSQGLIDPESGYPGFHILSRNDYDLQGGHGLDYRKIWNGANTIQKLLNVRNMEIPEGETEASFVDNAFKMFHEQDKAEFIEKHPGARDGSYAEAWNDYQRFLGNPTAESEAARVLPDTDLSEEEQDIAARRAAMPDFHTWVENYLNGDYADMLGALWPEDVLEDGVGPNGQRRMPLYKETDETQENHNQPILSKADRMDKWLFDGDAVGEQRILEGGQRQSETGGERVVIGANEEDQTDEQTNEDEQENTSEVIPPAGGVQGEFGFDTLPASDANNIWVWQADANNPLEGSWVWKEPTDADKALLETDLANVGWEDGERVPRPPTPPSFAERNDMIHEVLNHEFGQHYDMDDPDVQRELKALLRYHDNNTLINHHEKTVLTAARKLRDDARKEANNPEKVKPEDKPFKPDELERMIAAYKSAVQNRTQEPMSTEMENWLRDIASRSPKQFRHDYGEAIKLNEKHVAEVSKKQRERDANDIEGYRGILPLQQMPTEDDIKTQIRRLEYWKNKHGEHMSDKTQGLWNQRWQEISQAAANIPDFDIEEFIASDKEQAQQNNLEYGSEDHLKTVGKAHVTDMSTNAAYMKAVGEGASLRSNKNYKPWLVVKYDSNGAGTLHDLRQKDDVTGEWGKQIDPNSLAFDEDNHWFDYNETPGTQQQQSAAERFWSKLDRYANLRPLNHQGALERFDNDDAVFAHSKNLLGERGKQYGWFHPESGAWINPHRYNDVREELTNAGPGSGMVIPAGEHYHGSHRPDGQGEVNPRYGFARRGKAKIAQMNNNNDLSYYVDSQGNISHADGEWPVVQQKDTTQPQAVNDVIHDYYSQQFYNYFTQTADSFKNNDGNFLTGKVLRPPTPPQQPMQQMGLVKEVLPKDALERRRKQGYEWRDQPGSKNLKSDELGHSGEFWGRNQEYQQRYRDVFDFTGSGLLGWLGGIINPFAAAADVREGSSPMGKIGRGVKGVVSRALGQKDPSFEAVRRIRRQYRVDAEAEQRTKDVMDKLQVHGHPMRYLSPGESRARTEDFKALRSHISKRGNWHRTEIEKLNKERTRLKQTNMPKSQEHQDHEDEDLTYQGITNQLNGLNPELDTDWQHINRLYDQYMGNQQVQDKFAPHSDGGWSSRFENPPQDYQPSQGGQQVSSGLSGLIADDTPQSPQLQGLIADSSDGGQSNQLQGLIA